MSDTQIYFFIGTLGKKPEKRYTPSGQAVTSFSVASNRQYKSANGEMIKETIWHRVTVWGALAETCNQYLDKGKRVAITGRLVPDKATGAPRIWEKDGKSGASFEVNASAVQFLSPVDTHPDSMTEAAQDLGGQVSDEEDVPF